MCAEGRTAIVERATETALHRFRTYGLGTSSAWLRLLHGILRTNTVRFLRHCLERAGDPFAYHDFRVQDVQA